MNMNIDIFIYLWILLIYFNMAISIYLITLLEDNNF